MPEHVVNKVSEALNERGKPLKNSRILVMGVTYKKDVRDLRESPALEIMDLLLERGALLSYYDPFIPFLKIYNFNLKGVPFKAEFFKDSDCVLVLVDHTDVDYKFVAKHSKLVFDTRNVLRDVPKRGNIVKL
jgi:UDP-N-acetyl-D-glucosamine dehydrogenase